MKELLDVAGQRHLQVGGDPYRAADCNQLLNQDELHELLSILRSLSACQPLPAR
ncbi:hypothetical protein [Neosynechococcus sphagnicola]|uniref:hypothetical protein n=1 Tax=Neosynechococcus sphagnicola TaxID=1501145 RepID=UPI0012DFF4B6|nr:hypothetical protein [Neosynechococcus sphagnicola]